MGVYHDLEHDALEEMKRNAHTGTDYSKLLTAIILCQGAGFVGSLATFTSINTWYRALVKPPFNPPNWIFGPVWTVLYVLMGIALYLVWEKGLGKSRVRTAFWLFVLHLSVNFGWSVVFFGMHSIFGGFVGALVLWAYIVALLWKFYEIRPLAAYLLVPYLLWTSFAVVLNTSIWLLNR